MSVKPKWMRVRAPSRTQMEGMKRIRDILRTHQLHTVCQGAICPNAITCWGERTATFMILGSICTRACRFCGIPTGDPGGRVDQTEPERLASAVADLELEYVVITSVDRDDLDDGGASIFAESVTSIRKERPKARIELLIPDFSSDPRALHKVLAVKPDVIGHNMETVRARTSGLRDRRANYDQSLAVLGYLKNASDPSDTKIKTGLMLGLGETEGELRETFKDLADLGVDALTLGQYLQPTPACVPEKRFVPPEEFESLERMARESGIGWVVAGPLVRSSYRAADLFADG